jgi:hypothetical protein
MEKEPEMGRQTPLWLLTDHASTIAAKVEGSRSAVKRTWVSVQIESAVRLC